MVLVPTMRGNGNCGCSCGNLPYTVTVSLSDVSEEGIRRNIPENNIVSCTGSGAVVRASEVSGESCKASETYVAEWKVVSGGCGYAVLGRKEPVLVASVPYSEGIEFGKITLTPETPADCSTDPQWTGLPRWKVESIAMTVGEPEGYTGTEQITLRPESGVLLTGRGTPINSISAKLTFGTVDGVLRPTGVGVIDQTPIYQEDPELPALVPPSKLVPWPDGVSSVTTTVDSTVGSPTFGEVTAAVISGSKGWDTVSCYKRQEILAGYHVLRAANPKKLVSVEVESCWSKEITCGEVVTTRRVAPQFDAATIMPPTPPSWNWFFYHAEVSFTLAEETDEDGEKYWTFDTFTATGGRGYNPDTTYPICPQVIRRSPTPPACGGTVQEAALIDLEVAADGTVTSATLVDGGKYYRVAEYDGLVTGIKKVTPTVSANCSGRHAKKGREAPPTPSLTWSHTERTEPPRGETPGTGVQATVAWSQNTGDCGLPYWSVESVTLADGGQNYRTGDHLRIDPATLGGAVAEHHADFTVTVNEYREEPTVTASVDGGSGAVLSVVLSQSPSEPNDQALWHVGSVKVNDGGTGYANGSPVTFAVTDGTEVTGAVGFIVTDEQRENPNLTPYVWGYDGTTAGSGAVLSATMASNGDDPETWGVAAINVIDGGSGYSVGEYFWYSEFGGGFESIPPYYLVAIDGWLITSVDENGAITGIGLDGYGGAGQFYKLSSGDGEIQSVTIMEDGDYYKHDGDYSIESIAIEDAGRYYKESDSLPAIVSATARIVQLSPSNGTGAAVTPVVQTDPTKANFGCITKFTVDQEGSGYTLLGGPMGCEYVDGTITVQEWSETKKVDHPKCFRVSLNGPKEPIDIEYGSRNPLLFTPTSEFRTGEALDDCNTLPSTATALWGNEAVSVSLTAGGVWNDCITLECGCDTKGCCAKEGKYISPTYPTTIDSCWCEQQGGTWEAGRTECGCCCDGYEQDSTIQTKVECYKAGGSWQTVPCDSEPCCQPCSQGLGGQITGWVLRGTFFGPGVWVMPVGGIAGGGNPLKYTAPNGWQGEAGFPQLVSLLMRSEDSTLYACGGEWVPTEGDLQSDTIVANPPPDDGEWYAGVYVDGLVAWYPACGSLPCSLTFQGAGQMPVINSFNYLGCEEDVCCNGNEAAPTLAAPASCGHRDIAFGGPPGTPQAQCLGSCIIDGVCDYAQWGYTKDWCESLGGTWQSGVPCPQPDPCNPLP